MNYLHYDVCLRPGQIVEESLSNQANVRLLDDTNHSRYKDGQGHQYYGGLAKVSPVRLKPPPGQSLMFWRRPAALIERTAPDKGREIDAAHCANLRPTRWTQGNSAESDPCAFRRLQDLLLPLRPPCANNGHWFRAALKSERSSAREPVNALRIAPDGPPLCRQE
jgi:hypothetical protein